MPNDPAMAADQPVVSVIVPNWNGSDLLVPCLTSIRAQTYRRLDAIVVDDGSTDCSVSLIRAQFPDFRLVQMARNGGFAVAANAGMRAARGHILALLNNDAVADPGWVEALVAAFSRHPRAGTIASKMLLQSGGRIHSAGDLFRRSGVPDSRGVWEEDVGQYDDECAVFGACGGAAAFRREMLDRIGLFDERLFMYCEDVDLAFRAQRAGYECIYAPDAVVHHRLGGTTRGETAAYLCGRNFVWLIGTQVPWPAVRRYWPLMLEGQLRIAAEALRHLREPAARARLRGQLHGFLSVPALIHRRSAKPRSVEEAADMLRMWT